MIDSFSLILLFTFLFKVCNSIASESHKYCITQKNTAIEISKLILKDKISQLSIEDYNFRVEEDATRFKVIGKLNCNPDTKCIGGPIIFSISKNNCELLYYRAIK